MAEEGRPAQDTPCRYGWACHRADCWYTHPDGREIEGAPPPAGNVPNFVGGGYQSGGGNRGGGYQRPQFAGQAAPGMHSSTVYRPPAAANRGGQQVCRFRAKCNRPNCWFFHPEGRIIDDPDFDPDLEAVNDALDKLNVGNNSGDEVCPCCNGSPEACETPACKKAGLCACQGTATSKEDDTWKDEWFPGSRECECCKGFVYRCETKDPACNSGTCFCAHMRGSAKPTT
jgi:hypothetical protein